tara:strand:- start:1301 stop:1444 length:144 start_codon:yes stop_codon:yes gene_type:complete
VQDLVEEYNGSITQGECHVMNVRVQETVADKHVDIAVTGVFHQQYIK